VCPHCCSASYKNKENVDLSKVPTFARSESDVGSSEVQIARLTARVNQISAHLKTNRKDYSGQRGLQAVLAQRKKLLQYLYKSNRWVAGSETLVAPCNGWLSGDGRQQASQTQAVCRIACWGGGGAWAKVASERLSSSRKSNSSSATLLFH
jgi:ribosomal protein S15